MAKDDEEKPKDTDRVPSIPLEDIVKQDQKVEQERREREARWNEEQRKDRKSTD